MLNNFILCLILSVTAVYGGVSFRNTRGAQWQQTSNQPVYTPMYQPPGAGQTYSQQNPGYNNRTFGYSPTPVPSHVPGYAQPTPYRYNQTNTPGSNYQPVNQPTPYQPANPQTLNVQRSRFDNEYNATRPRQTPRLYPDLSNRFGGASGVIPPATPYGGPGAAPSTYPGYGGANSNRTNLAPINPNPAYGGSNTGVPSAYPPYGAGGRATTLPPNQAYGGGSNIGVQPVYQPYGGTGGSGTNLAPNPPYGGPNTNPAYGNYNTTRTNLPTFNPGARYNDAPQYGGQQPNPGANTWGHPNYQTPNGTQQNMYYNPRVYA